MKALEKVVDLVIKGLENGTVPWRKTWRDNVPMNVFSGRSYRGFNLFLLSFICDVYKYSHPFFGTYKQINEAGGKIKKGEKSMLIVYWKISDQEKVQDENGDTMMCDCKRRITPFCYKVFNLDQTEGIDIQKYVDKYFAKNNNNPLDVCEKVVNEMQHPPSIQHDKPGAFYVPFFDRVNVPDIRLFNTSEEYYATTFHELGHSTGHPSRLNRFENTAAVFGSQSYSFEELVAEMTATILCSHCGIEQTMNNSVSYLTGWAKYLKSERKTALFGAATKAQLAANYILGKAIQSDQPEQFEENIEVSVF